MPEDAPTHPVPPSVPERPSLRVAGAVAEPREFSPADLRSFEQRDLRDAFTCEEGWTVSGLHWRGVPAAEVVRRASPADDAAYALVRGGDDGYACAFPRPRLDEGLLALSLDGDPLDRSQGGPVRLVFPDATSDCWEQVKWVTRIDLHVERPAAADTARDVALSRIE